MQPWKPNDIRVYVYLHFRPKGNLQLCPIYIKCDWSELVISAIPPRWHSKHNRYSTLSSLSTRNTQHCHINTIAEELNGFQQARRINEHVFNLLSLCGKYMINKLTHTKKAQSRHEKRMLATEEFDNENNKMAKKEYWPSLTMTCRLPLLFSWGHVNVL